MSGLLLIALMGALADPPAYAAETHSFDIQSEEAAAAIRDFALQSGVQILSDSKPLQGKQFNPVKGEHSTDEGLRILLADTGLTHRYVGDHSIALVVAGGAAKSTPEKTEKKEARNPSFWERLRLARVDPGNAVDPQSSVSGGPETTSATRDSALHEYEPTAGKGIPEVLVKGSKVLNMDVKRSRDDAQPYVIFDRKSIERAGVATLDEFLKQRLPMNTQGQSGPQALNNGGGASQINLRGLGTNQTLILVDGHRMAGITQSGSPLQPDINGIPLAAIERIEVLPTTASGIYGGSATGGVVNIVLRRDYVGREVKLEYGNTFTSAAASRRADLSVGFALEGGKTNVLLSGSWVDQDDLLLDETDFTQRRYERVLANNGGNYDSLSTSNVPPLGSTTNIHASGGGNLTFKPAYGGGSLGSPITFIPVGYAGALVSGVSALRANAGRYNLDLAPTLQTGGGKQPVLANPGMKSAMLSIRREFSDRFQAFLDSSYSRNESVYTRSLVTAANTIAANAPDNPFTQAISVTAPVVAGDQNIGRANESVRLVGGAIVRLPGNWTLGLDHTWNKVTNESDVTPLYANVTPAIANGTLDVLRDLEAFPLNLDPYLIPTALSETDNAAYVLDDSVLRAAGSVFTLPAGNLTLSALLERRRERMDSWHDLSFNGTSFSTVFVPARQQTVNSGYLELQIPIVSNANAVTGVRSLDLQVAARRDEYETIGASTGKPTTDRNEVSSTDPTIGLRYAPTQDLTLRASYGTGFLPPNVSQLSPLTPRDINAGATDPRRNNERVGVIKQYQGGSPDLRPELSKSWSAGLILTPRWVPGARLSVDYTRIDKRDNIGNFRNFQEVLDNEALFPGMVARAPPGPGETVGRVTGLSFNSINLARAKVEAFDAQIDYHFDASRFGVFDLFAVGTWQAHYITQLGPTSPAVENVGFTSSSPLKFKTNFGLSWNRGPWTAGWVARYFDSYLVINPAVANTQNAQFLINQGNGGYVSSQKYHDVFAAWRFGSAAAFLSSAEIKVGILNVFNTDPPVDTRSAVGYSPFADPRLASYYVSLRAAF